MTEETRAELRRLLEGVAQAYIADTVVVKGDSGRRTGFDKLCSDVAVYYTPCEPPPLTTAQQLALSVLLGEPDRVVLSALCDLLIEQGHEYAVAVAEKARREERERCRKLVASLADAAMWAGDSSHGVLYSLCDDL